MGLVVIEGAVCSGWNGAVFSFCERAAWACLYCWASASSFLRRVSLGSVVIRACSSGEATTRIATWFWPAKKSDSPTSAVKSK